MRVKFWGTRGSIASPGADTVRYGGNTACVEVRSGSRLLILDAGTGIRRPGARLNGESAGKPLCVHLLISHTHWDHIQGLPFFDPIYLDANRIIVYGRGDMDGRLPRIFRRQMDQLHFPVKFDALPAEVTFVPFMQDSFTIGDMHIATLPLHHPGGGVAYRITHRRRSLVFATDNDVHAHPVDDASKSSHQVCVDDEFVNFIRDADLAILDAQYRETQYFSHIGWGHSSVESALEAACRAHVQRMTLFHHDPDCTDEELDQIVQHTCRDFVCARASSLECFAAAEGVELVI